MRSASSALSIKWPARSDAGPFCGFAIEVPPSHLAALYSAQIPSRGAPILPRHECTRQEIANDRRAISVDHKDAAAPPGSGGAAARIQYLSVGWNRATAWPALRPVSPDMPSSAPLALPFSPAPP